MPKFFLFYMPNQDFNKSALTKEVLNCVHFSVYQVAVRDKVSARSVSTSSIANVGKRTQSRCHMDDIIVWSKDVNQHDERLRGVLERAKGYKLRLSVKKCKIGQSQVPYIGHLLMAGGLKAVPEKV